MDKYRVMLMPRAYRDLDDLYRYIVENLKASGAAEKLIAEIESGILSLDTFPQRGTIRRTGSFANRGYRQIFVKNYSIIYRIDEENRQVLIVTVRYIHRK